VSSPSPIGTVPVVAELAADEVVDAIDRRHERRARHREIAAVDPVRPLAVIDTLDGFGNKSVDVEIALAMAMGPQVQRHVVDVRREVGAMIEIEPAQEVLIGLTRTRVLGGDQPRNDLEQLGDPQQRTHGQIRPADRAFARGIGNPDQPLASGEHHHFFQRLIGGPDVRSEHNRTCAGDQRRAYSSSHLQETSLPVNDARDERLHAVGREVSGRGPLRASTLRLTGR
jgi:hypothetical protein